MLNNRPHFISFALHIPQSPPDWQEILTYFRGSELQNYFTRVLEDNLKPVIKPQYVDHIPKAVRGNVLEVLKQRDQKDLLPRLLQELDLQQVWICGRRCGVKCGDKCVD